MQTIKINLKEISRREISLIAGFFKSGKTVAYPTDTIYGLGCLASDKKAVNKIHRIKKQTLNKPLLVLVSGLEMAEKYCYINREQKQFLKKIWFTPARQAGPVPHPNLSLARRGALRPVTVVLKRKNNLLLAVAGGLESLAVRLPKNDFFIKIIKKIGGPIVSTSLNITGEKPLNKVKGALNYFKDEKPDIVVDAGVIKSKPSKLIDIREIKNIKVIRK